MHSCGSFWHDAPLWAAAALPFLSGFILKARAWIHARRGCRSDCGHKSG